MACIKEYDAVLVDWQAVELFGLMLNKKGIIGKAVLTGGWHLFHRSAKMIPFGGTIAVFVLIGYDIRKKGVVRGTLNSGIDALPFIGLAKNAVEIFTGDFISDKPSRAIR